MALTTATKSERRSAILGAARQVFARDGHARALMDDIARAAQVGKGTIYEHFGSKDGLFLAVCTDVIEENVRNVRETIPAGGSPRARLGRFVRGLVQSLGAVRPLFGLYFEAWELASTRAELRDGIVSSFRSLYLPIRDLVAGLLRDGQRAAEFAKLPPDDAATIVLAIVDGLAYQSLFLFDPADLPRLARRAEEIVLAGLEQR